VRGNLTFEYIIYIYIYIIHYIQEDLDFSGRKKTDYFIPGNLSWGKTDQMHFEVKGKGQAEGLAGSVILATLIII
jgi:hypothetical protein